MGGLFKVLLFTSPVLALVFFYVVSQQSKIDTEMKKDEAQFERNWSEFESDFAKSKEAKKLYADRAEAAANKILELELKEKEKEEKAAKFEKEFEKSINDFEKQKGGKKDEKDNGTGNDIDSKR